MTRLKDDALRGAANVRNQQRRVGDTVLHELTNHGGRGIGQIRPVGRHPTTADRRDHRHVHRHRIGISTAQRAAVGRVRTVGNRAALGRPV